MTDKEKARVFVVANFWEGQNVIPSIRDRMKAVGLLEWEK